MSVPKSSPFRCKWPLCYMRDRALHRIALIATTDSGGESAVRNFNGVLSQPENKTMALIDTERFNVSDISIVAQMARIRAANPQAIVLWTAGTPFSTFLLALRKQWTKYSDRYRCIRRYKRSNGAISGAVAVGIVRRNRARARSKCRARPSDEARNR
jgi:hypothetical protein